MEELLSLQSLSALLTLTLLEVVLGIDNIIFISLVSNKLPSVQQGKARIAGLSLALIVRIIMLLCIAWIIGFTKPLFSVLNISLSGRDIILAAGGLFLLAKSTSEIHHKIEGEKETERKAKIHSFSSAIFQIVLIDIIFSFDSILTAIGMTRQLLIMIVAIIVSMIIMMIFAGRISRFIDKHPTLQVLALSFLILIGFMLILEALHHEVPKAYIYFAVFFSLIVELLNMRLRKKSSFEKRMKL